MKWPVAILAVLSVVSGWLVFFGLPGDFLHATFTELEHEAFHIDPIVFTAVMGVTVIGGGLAWYLYGPKGVLRQSERDLNARPGILVNMFYFDTLYEYVVILPVKALAEFCSQVGDATVIDGFVNGLGRLAAGVGSGLRGLQDGYIRRYALTVFTGVTLMLLYFIFYV